jgi:molecular chaperone GrpE
MIRQLFLLSSIASIDAFITPSSLHATHSISVTSWQSQPLCRPSSSSPLHADASTDGSDAAAAADATDAAAAANDAADEAADDAAGAETAAAPPAEDATDILNSPAFLKRKAEVLASDIAAVEKEIEVTNAAYLAGKKEWEVKFDMLDKEAEAMRGRAAKQGAQATETATVEVATKIIDVIDNYDRAFQAAEAATNEEVEIVDAYKETQGMVLAALLELNVTKVETVGAEFDYELHQALLQMPSEEHGEGIVCQEMAPGWTCGEKLIRPAMVAVAL